MANWTRWIERAVATFEDGAFLAHHVLPNNLYESYAFSSLTPDDMYARSLRAPCDAELELNTPYPFTLLSSTSENSPEAVEARGLTANHRKVVMQALRSTHGGGIFF